MNSGKRSRLTRLIALWAIASFISWAIMSPGSATAAPSPLGTKARAAALIDVQSGRLLYSQDGDTPMRIASLTKIMTAIVAIEHGNLNDMVKTSKRAFGREGSSIYLRLGEEMSLSNLLYGLMLRSGNDAATAIAEHVGGSEDGFVHLMNKKAEEIGLANSQFRNPHGLDEEGHYSTANDLAKLTAYALRNDVFAEIVKTRDKSAPNPIDSWDYRWHNKNKMLSMYEGADGVKTGYTKKAFRCLVSSATREGQQLAAVTINDGDDWADHRDMLDWGFKHYPLVSIVEKGMDIAGYPYVTSQRFHYPLEADEQNAVHSKLQLIDAAATAYALGERGRLEFYLNGQPIGAVPVYEPGNPRLGISGDAAQSRGSSKLHTTNSTIGQRLKSTWESLIHR